LKPGFAPKIPPRNLNPHQGKYTTSTYLMMKLFESIRATGRAMRQMPDTIPFWQRSLLLAPAGKKHVIPFQIK